MAVLIVTLVVAVVLRVFMYRTRTGTAMRAVVDNRELSGLAGASPAYFGQLGWMMGATLAAVAGVLLAALVTLDIQTLTLIVINGYAAAMVGRLRNLPLTFLGGVLLGLVQSYATGYLPVGNLLLSISPVIPMIFLFVILCIIPEGRVPGRVQSVRSPRVPKLKETLLFGVLLVAGAWVVSGFLSDPNLLTASHGLAYALVMLSLVPLSGYGGQVSLCQLTFAGIGAVVMDKCGDGSTWWGLVLALVITGAVGGLLALPALRLRGIYLALLTLAFGVAMDSAFFGNESIFGPSSSLFVGRVSVPGLSLVSDRAFFVAMCVVFAVFGVLILLLRRSAFGRRLVAVHDSPAACATLGISLVRTKVLVFALSAGMAGFAGALYGGAQGQVGPSDFVTLLSLTLFLLAVANGMRTVSGMLIGGVLLALFPVISTHLPWLRDLTYLGAGIIALSIGRNPDGLGNNPVSQWRARKAAERLSLPFLEETDPVTQDAGVAAHVGD
jgi:branched-chain amino acid transport system permease protein